MRYKILDQQGMNFLTFTIVEWIDLFTRPVYCDMLLSSLRYCQEKKGLLLYAYVIMPSHMHLIMATEEETGLSPIIQSFKSYTAKQIINYLHDKKNPESRRTWLLNHFAFNARKNSRNSIHQIWQRDNHPVLLYSPKLIRQKLNYIHLNPVKARMVEKPKHYLMGSASNYEEGIGVLDVIVLDNIWHDVGYVGSWR
jgi:putative transposase